MYTWSLDQFPSSISNVGNEFLPPVLEKSSLLGTNDDLRLKTLIKNMYIL